MRRKFRLPALAAVALALAALLGLIGTACTGEGVSPSAPTATVTTRPDSGDAQTYAPQQIAMRQLAINAGYISVGIPVHDGTRYTVTVQVGPECTGEATLGGNEGPESQAPTSFEVLEVGGTPMSEVLPDGGTEGWPPGLLRSRINDVEHLGCMPLPTR